MRTKEKFLTCKNIAEKIGVSLRHIQRVSLEEGWEYKEVNKNGAKEKRFAFSLLPMSLQSKLTSQTTALTIKSDTPINRLELESYNRCIADARFTSLNLFKEYLKESPYRKDKALGEFIDNWLNIASEEITKIIPSFSKRTFYTWMQLYENGGLIALAPAYGKRQGITKLPNKYHDLVLKAYLDQNQRSIRSIYNHIIHQIALQQLGENADFKELAETKRELKKEISVRVFELFIKNNTTKGLRSKARGQKLEREKITAFIQRDRSLLSSNDIWGSDGHDANTFVIDEYGNKGRPVIVVWMDEKSRMVMGWAVDMTENTDLIINSLCHAVESHGVPNSVYIDNGKAYINKRTSEKVQLEHRLTTYGMLGCDVINARPYNAREKSIERFWGRLDNDFSRWLIGYAGKDILSKPQATELQIKKNKLLGIVQYKEFLEKWFKKYNTDVHTGEGMDGLSPYEVWTNNIVKVQPVDSQVLEFMRLVFMNEQRSITSGGRIRARNITYLAPELLNHVGEKVTVGLDPQNLNRAYIFFNGKLLCVAENEIRADYTDTPKTQKTFRQRSKILSQEKKINKQLIENKKKESAILLAEKAEVLESAPVQVVEKIEKFDRYGY